jgi:hypothetical protein
MQSKQFTSSAGQISPFASTVAAVVLVGFACAVFGMASVLSPQRRPRFQSARYSHPFDREKGFSSQNELRQYSKVVSISTR